MIGLIADLVNTMKLIGTYWIHFQQIMYFNYFILCVCGDGVCGGLDGPLNRQLIEFLF